MLEQKIELFIKKHQSHLSKDEHITATGLNQVVKGIEENTGMPLELIYDLVELLQSTIEPYIAQEVLFMNLKIGQHFNYDNKELIKMSDNYSLIESNCQSVCGQHEYGLLKDTSCIIFLEKENT